MESTNTTAESLTPPRAPISILTSESSPPQTLAQQYRDRGCTDVFRVVNMDALSAVHKIIFEKTAHLINGADMSRPLHELITLPFNTEPTKDDVKGVVEAVESSPAFNELIHSSAVENAFKKVFGVTEVMPFPISRLRAQFPVLGKTTYDWHQDEGTWYAVKAKDLAHKMPATLWLSINGADESNSIELVPGTHRCKLVNHYVVSGQGFFNAKLPAEFENTPRFVVKTLPGEGVAFHPLTFHRSVKGQAYRPRYSIDIRYYCDAASSERYKVSLKFLLKRIFS